MENGINEDYQTPISQRATNALHDRRLSDHNSYMGTGNNRLHDAMHRAIKQMPTWITTDGKGHNSKYATLKNILKVVKPLLLEEGIRIRQGADRSYNLEGSGIKGRMVPIYTDLVHSGSGEVERTVTEIPFMKMDAQSMGSAITYGRRYSLLAALGLATDEADDDGQKTVARTLSNGAADSDQLIALQSELDKIDAVTDLVGWDKETKNAKRLIMLSDEEMGLLRAHWKKRKQDLLAEAPQ